MYMSQLILFHQPYELPYTQDKGVGNTIAHWQSAFAVLGIPHTIKTENGPAFISQTQTQDNSYSFGMCHTTLVFPTHQQF